jgi:hypothetical protein
MFLLLKRGFTLELWQLSLNHGDIQISIIGQKSLDGRMEKPIEAWQFGNI